MAEDGREGNERGDLWEEGRRRRIELGIGRGGGKG